MWTRNRSVALPVCSVRLTWSSQVTPNVRLVEDLGADSLSSVEIFLALEEVRRGVTRS